MTKEIEGKLVAALVYLESGNYDAVKEQIEEVVKLFEDDRLKRDAKKKNLVRQPKRKSGKNGKDPRQRLKKG